VKLVRFGDQNKEKPGLLDANGEVRDLSGVIKDVNPDTLDQRTRQSVEAIDPLTLPRVEAGQRLGPCVGRPGKFVCIGLNYHDHAVETGLSPPSEPVVFMKAVSAISGPHDDITLLRGSTKSDWEVELGIVIGKRARYITADQALDAIAGFCLVNDLSEREWQIERGGNWSKGKSGDGYGPIGPWLVTADEIPEPQAMDLWLERNGETMQSGSTADMIFPVTELIAYLSQCMSLNVGDIIATGTPAGVGLGRRPPVFLEDGDHLRLGITGLGEQSYQVFADNPS
jgi:2-keto-4-pentenoate hydratase/2-oxohepta-3-ene-1,7-dioic acid hydratase in catechol pathway|tara:strand:- start:943 stop:1794 length:852 start_codon:yes stop_codon:yes gene_type:complete